MPNDSKLGLLVGVAGVIIAAVLFYQDRPATATAQQTGPATAKPSNIFGKKPDVAKPMTETSSAGATRGKPEAEAVPVSRATPGK